MQSVRDFSVSWVRSHPFGTLAAVQLPEERAELPPEVLHRLHPDERAFAEGLRGFRLNEWVGARLAFGAALAWYDGSAEAARPALLTGAAGEPLAPGGLTVSLTHKRNMALALVARAEAGTVGIDLEGDERDRSEIAPKVLRPEELALHDVLPAELRWPSLCAQFALKEATYKAIFPYLLRYVSFYEARVTLTEGARPEISLFVRPDEPRLALEATLEPLEPSGPRVLAVVRARRL